MHVSLQEGAGERERKPEGGGTCREWGVGTSELDGGREEAVGSKRLGSLRMGAGEGTGGKEEGIPTYYMSMAG